MAEVRVGIVMGSDSDLPILRRAAETLEAFGVGWEMRCLSAHRNPEAVRDYACSASGRGLRVLIAGAGGAAHLPGVLAASTTLPVIGGPIGGKSLAGADSLYSIVQMPSGVPVATVGIDGAQNAGILAVQILALGDSALAARLEQHKAELVSGNARKDAAVQAASDEVRGGVR